MPRLDLIDGHYMWWANDEGEGEPRDLGWTDEPPQTAPGVSNPAFVEWLKAQGVELEPVRWVSYDTDWSGSCLTPEQIHTNRVRALLSSPIWPGWAENVASVRQELRSMGVTRQEFRSSMLYRYHIGRFHWLSHV
jgi:hypothetical protein